MVKIMWEDIYGNNFEDEDAVYDDAIEKMDIDDYVDLGDFRIQELLSIIFQNEIYDSRLEAKLEEARKEYIERYYTEIEEESEEQQIMNDYPKMRCPKCGGIIEHDDTYDSYADENYLANLCVGHCVKCESSYQWKEEFIMKFDGIADFEEVT